MTTTHHFEGTAEPTMTFKQRMAYWAVPLLAASTLTFALLLWNVQQQQITDLRDTVAAIQKVQGARISTADTFYSDVRAALNDIKAALTTK